MKLRERVGKTQREVALELNVTTQTISNWETGQRVPRLTPKQTYDLCKILDCTLEDLIDGLSDLEDSE
mgnify:FL=1